MVNYRLEHIKRRVCRLSWRWVDGKFYSSITVNKKFLGDFNIGIEVNSANGETRLDIAALKHPRLKKEAKCMNLEDAIYFIVSYIEELDVLVKKIPRPELKRAQDAYDKIVAQSIMGV